MVISPSLPTQLSSLSTKVRDMLSSSPSSSTGYGSGYDHHQLGSQLYETIPGPVNQPGQQQYQQAHQSDFHSLSGPVTQFTSSQPFVVRGKTSSSNPSNNYSYDSHQQQESHSYANMQGHADQHDSYKAQYQHTSNYNQAEHNPHNFEVGSKILYGNPPCSGVIKWMGHPHGMNYFYAGIEMVCE